MLISSNDFGSVLNSGGVMTTFSVQTPTRMNWVVQQIKNQNGQMSYPLASTSPSASSSFHSPLYFTNFQRDAVPLASSSSSRAPPVPSSSSRISPAVLFIIVILAVIFFISGLLHLLIKFLIKQQQPSSSSSPQSNGRYPRDVSGSEALQRQLQQLFHLHDSGLDQAFIDALPVFLYKEIVGPKEPFDCAVCLCEFTDEDKLRLLPVCSHAFHLNCIDTWLLSNSTCPLCRGSLFIPGLTIENPVFDFSDLRDEDGVSGDREDGLSLPGQKPGDLEEGDGALVEKKVFPVRLGKFRSLYNGSIDTTGDPEFTNSITNNVGREEGESSSSSLDARRCYSMGSYQYVVGDSILKVALNSGGKDEDDKGSRRDLGVNSAAVSIVEGLSGKRLCVGSKGESFSVSKIWQWSNKKGKFPMSSSDTASLDGSLSWIGKSRGGDT